MYWYKPASLKPDYLVAFLEPAFGLLTCPQIGPRQGLVRCLVEQLPTVVIPGVRRSGDEDFQ